MIAHELSEGLRAPLVIERAGFETLPELIGSRRAELSERLIERGALLFRGFCVTSPTDFDLALAQFTEQRMDYLNGSSPRSAVGNRIFTSTEHPAELPIELHNECSYQRVWPLQIAFCCLQPARTGGETPIADVRAVTACIAEDVMNRFEERGVEYIRHFRPFIDVPWQRVFQTDDKQTLAQICARLDIAHQWLDEQTLRTSQVCQGVARHPVTGERLFFNQAHLFHVSSHAPQEMEALIELFGRDTLPKHCRYGDGQEIAIEDLENVRAALRRNVIAFPWQAGDVLLLDNMQVAHGRNPFTGTRRVIASLLDPYPPDEYARAQSCYSMSIASGQ